MAKKVSSAEEMVRMFAEDASLVARLKADVNPIPLLKETAATAEARTDPAYLGDRLLYRIAIAVLGTLAVLAALGSIGLVAFDKTTPEVLVALGSAAVGALVGLFAPSPAGK